MKGERIAKRYAKTLSGMLSLEELPHEIARLEKLSGLIEADKKLKGFFVNPLFHDQEKNVFLNHLSDKIGFSEKTRSVLLKLLEERAFIALPLFIKFLNKFYAERKRLLKATVLSPIPVDGGMVERITNALRNITQKDVRVDVSIAPELLGGIVVRFDNTVYDLSLRGQLNILKNEIIKG
ncbi:MAG: ATP synthase F1 subunit delta [Thermodesulfovibrionales bacterium]|nr:ATP synthase F1 subunit delta [Thermodesulfovibrionales bacterium]